MNRNSPVYRDWAVLGFATGAAASILKSATSQVLRGIGVDIVQYGTMGSGLILGRKVGLSKLTAGRPKAPEVVLGYVVDSLVGGAFGASICRLVQSTTPPGHELLKGMGAGALLAVGTMSVGRLLKVDGLNRVSPEQALATIAMGAFYGAAEGFVMGKYGANMITQSHPVIVKQMSTRQFNSRRRVTGPSER